VFCDWKQTVMGLDAVKQIVVQQINRCLKRHIKNDFLKAV
jgi:hypothetical protein